MRVIRQLEDLRAVRGPIVLAAGYFDGVHRGHQAVIAAAVSAARDAGAETWVLTMDPHPLKVLRPDAAPRLLTSTPHKLRLLEKLGVAGVVVLPFTRQLAAVLPEDFIARLRAAAPHLQRMVIGPNWTFGRAALGTPDTLRALARQHGFAVTVAEPVLVDGQPISSTRVREAVLLGQLNEAARLLGHPFSVRGTVVHGKHLGRRLGFPTANVDAESEVRPPAGIYAVRVEADAWTAGGAAYLGPSAPGLVEVHLLDRSDDVYGQTLEVAFVRHLRDDRRFPSTDALRRQIAHDVESARLALAHQPG